MGCTPKLFLAISMQTLGTCDFLPCASVRFMNTETFLVASCVLQSKFSAFRIPARVWRRLSGDRLARGNFESAKYWTPDQIKSIKATLFRNFTRRKRWPEKKLQHCSLTGLQPPIGNADETHSALLIIIKSTVPNIHSNQKHITHQRWYLRTWQWRIKMMH